MRFTLQGPEIGNLQLMLAETLDRFKSCLPNVSLIDQFILIGSFYYCTNTESSGQKTKTNQINL